MADAQNLAQTIRSHSAMAMPAKDALRKLESDAERCREYVVAHTLVEKGVGDFDLQGEAVERLRRAQDACSDIVRAALEGAEASP